MIRNCFLPGQYLFFFTIILISFVFTDIEGSVHLNAFPLYNQNDRFYARSDLELELLFSL